MKWLFALQRLRYDPGKNESTEMIIKEKKETNIMQKYFCNPCGYTYDPAKGDPEHNIAPGTAFEDLPADWCCPLCGVSKDMFQPCIDNYN